MGARRTSRTIKSSNSCKINLRIEIQSVRFPETLQSTNLLYYIACIPCLATKIATHSCGLYLARRSSERRCCVFHETLRSLLPSPSPSLLPPAPCSLLLPTRWHCGIFMLGPLGSSSTQRRRTLELVLQKRHASFRITFRPPGAEDRGKKRLTCILNRAHDLGQRGSCLTHTHQDKASRLKAHSIPSLGSYELQQRIPQMSNHKHRKGLRVNLPRGKLTLLGEIKT
jgi:hypothetical protein